jgi:hypothetical protein
MLSTYADARTLTWRVTVPRRRVRHAVRTTVGRQALRHGVRGAVKTACLSAALLAGSGAVGTARVPIVLSEPSQPAAVHATAATAPGAGSMSGSITARVTTR